MSSRVFRFVIYFHTGSCKVADFVVVVVFFCCMGSLALGDENDASRCYMWYNR
jgi:hypothetical protein